MKIVINECFGGFGLSKKATEWLAENGYQMAQEHLNRYKKDWYDFTGISRTDPLLISVVELLKEEANGEYSKLAIKDVDFNLESFIEEYDGNESLRVPCIRTY